MQFHLEGVPPEAFRPLRERLKPFTEENVCRRLGVADLDRISIRHMPFYESRMQGTPLDALIMLFLLRGAISRRSADALGLQVLLDTGVLAQEGEAVRSHVDLMPCQGMWIATDPQFAERFPRGHVYPLGSDSYRLARGMLTAPVESALDLCTGSGVQGLLASRFARRVVCVDINPRALEFTRFNALLNDLKVETRLGDLYEPVRDERFDLVLCNPPFVPTPREQSELFFRDGGDAIHERILRELPLNPGGRCQITTLLIFDEQDYTAKVRGWLRNEMSVLVGRWHGQAVADYILSQLPYHADYATYAREVTEYHDHYRKLGIRELADGLITLVPGDARELRAIRPLRRNFAEDLHRWAFPPEDGPGRWGQHLDVVAEGIGPDRHRYGAAFLESGLFYECELTAEEHARALEGRGTTRLFSWGVLDPL